MKKPNPKSVLSFDVGRKRIGLAGCDPLGITISSLPAIQCKDLNEDIKILKRICLERKVEGLIIGLPLDEAGKPTIQSKYSKKIGGKIAIALNLPVA